MESWWPEGDGMHSASVRKIIVSECPKDDHWMGEDLPQHQHYRLTFTESPWFPMNEVLHRPTISSV